MKGLGYIVESFVAILTLFVFAVGAQGVSPAQDWSSYRLQVESQDLTEVVEASGGLDALERGETGTLTSFAQHVSQSDLKVSGTADIPIQDFSVAFPILTDQRQVNRLRDLESGDRCYDRLGEIESESEAQVLRPKNPDDNLHQGRLYVADTDPRSAGSNGVTDYDTLYVDNETSCQFSSSEGPFFVDDYFRYSNGSSGAEFQFKNVAGSSGNRELLYYNASQVLRFREPTRKKMNGITTSVSFDTINISKASLPDYDVITFRRDGSLKLLDKNKNRLEAFSGRGGSLFLLMNLTESQFDDSDFLSSTQLTYVSGMSASPSGDLGFSSGRISRSVRKFNLGIGGDIDKVSLGSGASISSSVGRGTLENPVVGYSNAYSGDDWNATDFSMTPNSSPVNGAPISECYDQPEGLTTGTLQLPDGGKTTTYDIINAELGRSDAYCQDNDLRALMIDYDNDGSYEPSEGEGPFVGGDEVSKDGRRYNPFLPSDSTAQLVFAGSTDLEAINYVELSRGGILARAAYGEEYSSDDRRMLVAVIYQLLPEISEFGSSDRSASAETLSSTNQSFYMPYTADLRWSSQ
jgi:hypothetical protein